MTEARTRSARTSRLVRTLVAAAMATGLVATMAPTVHGSLDGIQMPTTKRTLKPRFPNANAPATKVLSPENALRYMNLREERAAKASGPVKAAIPNLVEDAGPEAQIDGSNVPTEAVPQDFDLALNRVNNVTLSAGQNKSTVGEPAVVKVGRRIFYTGNWFASYSSNEGVNWTQRALPAPLFPNESFCCDQDLEYDSGRDRVFWSLLYVSPFGANQGPIHGTITIAVMNAPDAAPSCIYDLENGTNHSLDYPHLSLSNDYLYLTYQDVDSKGTLTNADDAWISSNVERIPIDAISACGNLTSEFWTFGGSTFRIFQVVEGATDTAYWGQVASDTTFTLYEWKESSASVSSFTRTITSSPEVNPDCRGGTNNADWIERTTHWRMFGFRMRGWVGNRANGGTSLITGREVVGFMWNVGATHGSHTQAHVHMVIFDRDTKSVLSQPALYNSGNCTGFPDVAVNSRGYPGIIVAYGGKSGGGGSAVRNAVFLGDDTQSGGTFGDVFGAGRTINLSTGTHNPSDGRYGDYLTVQQGEPCDNYMVAGGFSYNGGSSASNVEHRVVEFGRYRDRNCWLRWHNAA